jgi:hypothetical protein
MRVEVIERPVRFIPPAVLILNGLQAEARRHNLRPIKGDRYRVLKEVEFKVGEVFGIAEVNLKAMSNLKPIEDEKK